MNNNQWMNVSDIMSVLMMTFLFISILYMYKVDMKTKNMENISSEYIKINKKINSSLKNSFQYKLSNWEAKLTEDNIIVFKNPETLFEIGNSQLTEKFSKVLHDFFPNFIDIIEKDNHLESIELIEIIGHASEEWKSAENELEKYLKNLTLSQSRSNNVLNYCLKTIDISKRKWVLKKISSRGASSSESIITTKNKEDKINSRRVEFKIKLKTNKFLSDLIDIINSQHIKK